MINELIKCDQCKKKFPREEMGSTNRYKNKRSFLCKSCTSAVCYYLSVNEEHSKRLYVKLDSDLKSFFELYIIIVYNVVAFGKGY